MGNTYPSYLMLSSGEIYSGYGVGFCDIIAAELCFTTSMLGYQHSISDPSFASQIVIFTFPHVGNIGINNFDTEREKIFTSGVVFRNKITESKHHLTTSSFDDWLKKNKIVGIYGVDTRRLTRDIVENGVKNAVIFSERISKEAALEKLLECNKMDGMELTHVVAGANNVVNENYEQKRYPGIKIAIVDFGLKNSVLAVLNEYFEICVIKAREGFYDAIIECNVDGIVLSSGPGDPNATSEAYANIEIKKILSLDLPVLGICLGHQLIALSLGCKTYKLQNPHRGTNHPVYNIQKDSVEISSQNHGFVVSKENLPEDVLITHYSLFDESIEGITIRNKSVFSVQYHPEASPGPNDSQYIFKQFIDDVTTKKYGSLC